MRSKEATLQSHFWWETTKHMQCEISNDESSARARTVCVHSNLRHFIIIFFRHECVHTNVKYLLLFCLSSHTTRQFHCRIQYIILHNRIKLHWLEFNMLNVSFGFFAHYNAWTIHSLTHFTVNISGTTVHRQTKKKKQTVNENVSTEIYYIYISVWL